MIKEAIEEDLAEGYREMDARELQKLNQVLSVLIQFLKIKGVIPPQWLGQIRAR